jgi:hypothetical protein
MRPMPDVMVVLPGITGSVLRDAEGRDLWAPTAGAITRALITLGGSITGLELRADDADDGVTAPLLVPDLHLIPGLWKIDGYSRISAYLQQQFAVTPGRNFFTFPYDWRRDNRAAARRLKEQAGRWLWDWRRESPEAKLILIGHSMGGLVARYYLECLDGWRDTRRLVTLGTPYRGSLNALSFLVRGMKEQLGPIPVLDLSRLLRSFPSVYQLLPIYPCLDAGGGAEIRISEAVALPHVDPERARAADAFHREIERAVTAHLDNDEYRRGRYTIHPIVGTFQGTLQSARTTRAGVEFLPTLPGFEPDGDGTVPRVSATPIEFPHEERAMFVAERHASLQHNDSVLVQLAGLLSGQDTSRVRANVDAGLELDDAFGPGEPVIFRYRAADPMAPLTAILTAAASGAEVARVELGAAREWRGGEIAPPAPGTYRLILAGDGVEPVTDTFVVVGEHELEESDFTGAGRSPVRGVEAVTTRSAPEYEVLRRVLEADHNRQKLIVNNLREEAVSPVPEQRFLQGRFPERVRLGEEVSLLVRLGLQHGARLEAGLKPVTVPSAGLDVVLLLVDSPGFVLRSPERQTVHILPRQDSDWTGFELQAVREGVHTLQVEAFAGGSGLGGLAVQVGVDAATPTGPSTERSSPATVTAPGRGEVSLLLSYDPGPQVYRYQLVDAGGYYAEEAASDRLLQPPGQAIEELVTQVNALARGQSAWDAATTKAWLKNQGIKLWKSFIPADLQREFWQRRDEITQMTIVSKGDPVPWELLYPLGPRGEDAGFLIDQFSLARRRYGRRPPSTLRLTSADLVLSGDGTLTAAPAEISALDGLLRGLGLSARRIGDLPSLLEVFQRGDIGLLHFSCHNAFARGAPNASRVLLANQPFEPVFLEQHAGRFTAPMVFLNACRTDGQAPLYTTVEGWAASFLQAGAGVFIGSLWEVTDTSASIYAQEFYRAALAGSTLGESARQARDAIRDRPGDPTWLAYTLYGDPAATVNISSVAGQ